MTSGRQCYQSPSFQPLTKRNEGSGDENGARKERGMGVGGNWAFALSTRFAPARPKSSRASGCCRPPPHLPPPTLTGIQPCVTIIRHGSAGCGRRSKTRKMENSDQQLQAGSTVITSSGVTIESGSKGHEQSRSISGVRNFLAGGIGGMFGITIGHPLDTIKVYSFLSLHLIQF